MSALTSSIAESWSGVSVKGKASSSSRCHGRVRSEGVPGRGLAGGVELHELRGDLADRLAGAALRLRPVGAAELVQRGHLAADVAADLVQGVRRDEQPVGRLPPLARRVLQHEVLAGRAADRPLPHLDEAADAVLGVHDVVARLQRDEVDGVAPALAAQRARVGGAAARLPVTSASVSSTSPPPVVRPSVRQPQVTVTSPGSGAADSCSTSLAGTSASRSCSIARCAVPGPATTSTATPPDGDVRTQVRQRPVRVAAVRLDLVHGRRQRRRPRPEISGLSVTTGWPGRRGVLEHLVEAAVRAGADVDRGVAADTGGEPARLEELLTGADEVPGTGADPLRVGEQHRRAGRAAGR